MGKKSRKDEWTTKLTFWEEKIVRGCLFNTKSVPGKSFYLLTSVYIWIFLLLHET